MLLGTVLALYLGLCALLFAVQRSLLFPAPRELASPQDLERVEIPGGTFALYRLAPGDGPVVVHFHGNGEQVASLSWLGQAWLEHGCSFVAVEYPGYPGTEGEATEASIVAAAEAALLHLTGPLKIARSRLVLEGQSLGTGVAMTMATRGWGVRLVLISPYTSLPDVAGQAFPWLPTGWLLLDRFDSASRAPLVNVPTLVVHGTLDSVVPIELGQKLCAAIPGARFLAVKGGHHHDLLDRDAPLDALFAFVKAR